MNCIKLKSYDKDNQQRLIPTEAISASQMSKRSLPEISYMDFFHNTALKYLYQKTLPLKRNTVLLRYETIIILPYDDKIAC